jgi:hypothetical protein
LTPDFGCGVVQKLESGQRRLPSSNADADLIRRWRALGQDFDAIFPFFQQHRAVLLNLRSVEEFLALAPLPAPR